ncbi:hypothetical protein AVT69_gp140 [Pseudomonas phage PhiPA3]|uniref:Uncharacterized protein 142 n=1 Tax=Pseudomonas phage PhiPA3 TaxID=998086 RepID=F8SK15_BPPA3|nr:hypothetical protein AVT69_gp140 [Pseudomonas phage PhiPA3]AEH03565.1 hypothetical protein [Pseudomonas phage PhiPA3]
MKLIKQEDGTFKAIVEWEVLRQHMVESLRSDPFIPDELKDAIVERNRQKNLLTIFENSSLRKRIDLQYMLAEFNTPDLQHYYKAYERAARLMYTDINRGCAAVTGYEIINNSALMLGPRLEFNLSGAGFMARDMYRVYDLGVELNLDFRFILNQDFDLFDIYGVDIRLG